MKAWVVSWEPMSENKAVKDPFVAFLPARWGQQRVCSALELLYASATFTAAEFIGFAKQSRPGLAPAEMSREWVYCGDNTCMVARKVKNVEVEANYEQGIERISWSEPKTTEPFRSKEQERDANSYNRREIIRGL